MNRKHHLTFCKRCTKRSFDPKKGIVCKLTGEHADFEKVCPDFEEDKVAAKEEQRKQRARAEAERNDGPGVSAFGMKNKVIGGGLSLLGGLVWLIGGFVAGRIFFYPFILIIGGIIAMVQGASENKRKRGLKNISKDTLDGGEITLDDEF